MRWTERYEIRSGCQVFYSGSDRSRLGPFSSPAWKFPLIRRERLINLLEEHYPERDFAWIGEFMKRVPVMFRGYHMRHDWFDLRDVALLAKRGTPSMRRCAVCRKRITEEDKVSFDCKVCSFRCFEIDERRRKREWKRIVLCRSLLREARSVIRNRRQEASR